MLATSPAITCLAPWFGSKRTLAPAIVAELGRPAAYWELFAGSLAVLLAKEPSRSEVVNDLHGDLVHLLTVLRHPRQGARLYRMLRRTLFSEAEFAAALERLDADPVPTSDEIPDVGRAFAYFVASWQGMNGLAGTEKGSRTFARRYTSTGGDPATRWSAAVRSIPWWRRRIEKVQVLRSCGIMLAGKIEDREGTVIYADPPYLKKGASYLHDFIPSQHVELAEALGRFRKTRVVVSYYDDPELMRLYPGWTVKPLGGSKGLANASKRDATGATAATEVLLINHP